MIPHEAEIAAVHFGATVSTAPSGAMAVPMPVAGNIVRRKKMASAWSGHLATIGE